MSTPTDIEPTDAERHYITAIDDAAHIHEVSQSGDVRCVAQLDPEHIDIWIKKLWEVKQSLVEPEVPADSESDEYARGEQQ